MADWYTWSFCAEPEDVRAQRFRARMEGHPQSCAAISGTSTHLSAPCDCRLDNRLDRVRPLIARSRAHLGQVEAETQPERRLAEDIRCECGGDVGVAPLCMGQRRVFCVVCRWQFSDYDLRASGVTFARYLQERD